MNIDVSPISELRVQRYYYFLDYPNFSTTFLSFWCDILVFCQLFLQFLGCFVYFFYLCTQMRHCAEIEI